MTLAEVILILCFFLVILGFLFLVSLDRKARKARRGRPRRTEPEEKPDEGEDLSGMSVNETEEEDDFPIVDKDI